MSGLVEVAKESGVKPEVITNLFETILSMVSTGEKVRIKNFGVFERRRYKGRTITSKAVNDGEAISYPDSHVLKFRQSGIAKRRLNIVAKKAERAAAAQKKPKKAEKSPPPPAAKKAKKKPKAEPADDEE
jgi:nucleoid DNA-binding protein